MRKASVFILLVVSILFFADVTQGNVEVKFLDKTFVRGTAEPGKESVEFTGNCGPALMKLIPSSRMVSSANVTLNGQDVFVASDLNPNVSYLEEPVVLRNGTNLLGVCLRGKPGADIRIEISQQFSWSIDQNATWAGLASVTGPVVVESDVTLTIAPGTRVEVKHYRGYREPENRLHFIVNGRIVAEGTPQMPIYFTSNAPDPQNGDWSMMRLYHPTGQCIFRYCVFEFAQQGLNVWDGDVVAANCVFRWNNWEGIYFESASTAALEYCQIYEDGYNGLAAEQFNTLQMDFCEVWRNGTNGVHVDATTLRILRSLVHENKANGLSVDDNGTLRAYGVAVYKNAGSAVGCGEGTNIIEVSNLDLFDNGGGIEGPYTTVGSPYYPPASIDIGFTADQTHALGYIPGDPVLDKYMYVYPDDETRRIARKIGAGLGLTWSVAWDGANIWTATLDGDVYKLNPITGNVLQSFKAPGPQPWGMTYDGTHLWLVDFAEKRISKIDPAAGTELASFPTPDPVGGCKGVAWDGTHLNVMGWTSSTIYQMDRSGNLISTILLDHGGGGGIAWDGHHFWVPGGKIYKYDTLGQAVGFIYPASEGTWDMAWDGQYLWATQRTNENWSDDKIFALEVLEVKTPD